MVVQIYPTDLQLNKANSADTEARFFFTWTVHNEWYHLRFMINGMILILK